MTTKTLLRCHSNRQIASLGPVPPRMPGRTDAQVPENLADGPARYARFPHLYFYDEATTDDAAFGFVDLEISVQRLASGRHHVELYCSGDGYQSGSGHDDGSHIELCFAAGERIAAITAWPYPDVVSGRSDPLTFRAPLDLSDADFAAIDRIIVPPATANCRIDLD